MGGSVSPVRRPWTTISRNAPRRRRRGRPLRRVRESGDETAGDSWLNRGSAPEASQSGLRNCGRIHFPSSSSREPPPFFGETHSWKPQPGGATEGHPGFDRWYSSSAGHCLTQTPDRAVFAKEKSPAKSTTGGRLRESASLLRGGGYSVGRLILPPQERMRALAPAASASGIWPLRT